MLKTVTFTGMIEADAKLLAGYHEMYIGTEYEVDGGLYNSSVTVYEVTDEEAERLTAYYNQLMKVGAFIA